MSENIIVEIIKGLVSIVVALLGFYAVHSFNQYSKRKNQDEQTEWVSRLIKVATETTEDTLTEETVFQVLSALRPFPHKEADPSPHKDYKDKNGFDEFTDISIKYCNKVLELNTDESLKDQAKKIRLIANILLKYHWEWQDFTTSSTFDSTRKGLKKFQLTFFRYKEYNDKCYKIFEQFKKEFPLL